MKHLDVKQIEEIIPHRHPFLLVDYIEDYEPGEFAAGYKCVTFREDFFRGHFPQEPVMPGVLMVEALAQVGAVAILSLEDMKGKTAYFGGIKIVAKDLKYGGLPRYIFNQFSAYTKTILDDLCGGVQAAQAKLQRT